MSSERTSQFVKITDVWSDNLTAEFDKIIKLAENFPFIAMDTEFPGVVAKPTGNFKSSSEYQYHTLRCNVNLLKIIQIGMSFGDENGNIPLDGGATWQFHFKFDLKEDMYAQDSIDLLNTSGIDFEEHKSNGIDVRDFAELLTVSGFVLSKKVRWISFHSAYDFGYLIKILTAKPLPDSEKNFFDLLYRFFPHIYDVKYLMRSCDSLKGGLSRIGTSLGCKRIGPAHQAGSDSLLTLDAFFKMMKNFFENKIYDKRYVGILFGLGQGYLKEIEKKESFQSLSYTPNRRFTSLKGGGGGLQHYGFGSIGQQKLPQDNGRKNHIQQGVIMKPNTVNLKRNTQNYQSQMFSRGGYANFGPTSGHFQMQFPAPQQLSLQPTLNIPNINLTSGHGYNQRHRGNNNGRLGGNGLGTGFGMRPGPDRLNQFSFDKLK